MFRAPLAVAAKISFSLQSQRPCKGFKSLFVWQKAPSKKAFNVFHARNSFVTIFVKPPS